MTHPISALTLSICLIIAFERNILVEYLEGSKKEVMKKIIKNLIFILGSQPFQLMYVIGAK